VFYDTKVSQSRGCLRHTPDTHREEKHGVGSPAEVTVVFHARD